MWPFVFISSRAWNELVNRVTQLEEAMTDVNADQGRLDADVERLNKAVADIEAEVAALKDAAGSGTPLDFTALEAAVGRLDADTPDV